MTYLEIAREKAAIVEHTGLLGEGSVWSGPRVVSRFFIDGFGSAGQRSAWSGKPASVAISEPRVGAHPKLLATRADAHADGYTLVGEKAWVSNGPLAEVFVVLAIMAAEDGRKRYGAFLVPRNTPGLSLNEPAEYRALAPSRHCGLVLDLCQVARDALLGAPFTAYETMALPFRDVEDAVATYGLLGALRYLLARLAAEGVGEAELGELAGLIAVFADAAECTVRALDDNTLARKAATLVGLHTLAAELLRRARTCRATGEDAIIERTLSDIEVSLSVARGPRQTRLLRLGAAIIAN